ncbi:hypothetical protein PSECIP111951_02544 [Pseudoalteromonas holothuriae]|uniref:DUF3025 domain-containing protein n=1 Tax=Pseudoalteromonas holothuriae TaxID=2963714 RepID=A0A9W4R141_9GAMM|nr:MULTISPECIES: DUF3025 domain-containing protein [unclassified Pseudoalteromonas]CAH9061707.1 hypothetical protein PSECIP111951_02544 [Pseudoalteromonas sp. CIP111951]CAH9061995.1 hypothetical protein PSECIP111854_02924 [Pseudoalteromonas sp. CIP111854]
MKKFTPPEAFNPQLLNGGAFEHLTQAFQLHNQTDWPSFEWLNSFVTAQNHLAKPIVFVPDAQFKEEARYYEQIIFETACVPTREKNWHDLFGAMIWSLFPNSKTLLNKRHIHEINLHGLKQRSRHRNALTLFDECGVLLAMTDEHFATKLKAHQWHDVFVEQRQRWGKDIKPFIFGHANYEMLTQPFIGLTGKVLCVIVDNAFFELSLTAQYQKLDEQLVDMIEHQGVLNDNSALSPLPLLGVPNWCDKNTDPEFYNNTDYFRPKRRNTHDRSQGVKKTL